MIKYLSKGILSLICAFLCFGNVVTHAVKPPAIPIAMALDENYLYPTIVSITSIIANKKPDTNYSFYLMHPKELSKSAKEKLLSLQKDQCKITLIDMGDRLKGAYTDARITVPAYYRLYLSVLPELFPIKGVVIWLDGDTIVRYDLSDFWLIGMSGYYYKGFLDDEAGRADEFHIVNDHYICSGVMLVNLDELRSDNICEEFDKFIAQHPVLPQHDQTVINVVCYKKTGILPAKYGIFNVITPKYAQKYIDILRTPQKYSLEEVVDACHNPWILHCVAKPWRKATNIATRKLWLEYAKQTDFFEEIKAHYPDFSELLD